MRGYVLAGDEKNVNILLTLVIPAAELKDLSQYHSQPEVKGAIAWPVLRTEPNLAEKDNHMTFTVKAQIVEKIQTGEETEAKPEAKTSEEKDEL